MLPQTCEPIMQTINALTQQLDDIDHQIDALNTEALNQLNPLHYFRMQPTIDHLSEMRQALQDEWNDAMNELFICQWNLADITPSWMPA